MSVDILGTSCDQCPSMVQYCFMSTETRRLIRMDSPGRPPRLSHSSWTMCIWFFFTILSVLLLQNNEGVFELLFSKEDSFFCLDLCVGVIVIFYDSKICNLYVLYIWPYVFLAILGWLFFITVYPEHHYDCFTTLSTVLFHHVECKLGFLLPCREFLPKPQLQWNLPGWVMLTIIIVTGIR